MVKHVSRYEMKEQKLAWFSISLHDDFVYVLWEHHNFDLATPFSEGPCVLKSSETKQVDKTRGISETKQIGPAGVHRQTIKCGKYGHAILSL